MGKKLRLREARRRGCPIPDSLGGAGYPRCEGRSKATRPRATDWNRVIELHLMTELTRREIAAACKCSPQRVAYIIDLARKAGEIP